LLDHAWGRPETTANVKLPKDIRDLSTEELFAILVSYEDASEETGEGERHGTFNPHSPDGTAFCGVTVLIMV